MSPKNLPRFARLFVCCLVCSVRSVQSAETAARTAPLPGLPAPLGVPAPGPMTDTPYAPQPILPGGVIVPLFPPGSPYLKMERVREAEVYNLGAPGQIASIVNIHNPSIEFHPGNRSLNTGTVVILAAGGGHNTLNVGGEGADFVPFFSNHGVSTVILRNRLRRGFDPVIGDTLSGVIGDTLIQCFSRL